MRAACFPSFALLLGLAAPTLSGCGDDSTQQPPGGAAVPHSLFVAHEGNFVAYDVETGEKRGGVVASVAGATGMQSLADGTVLANMTSKNEILVVDGREVREASRHPSSSMGGTRPVDSYISPDHGGKQYWVTLNDGTNNPGTTTAIFVDLTEGSPTRLKPVGEVAIGNGHHQASFSATKERLLVSSFYSCDNVFGIYDYGDPSMIQTVGMVTAMDLGFDGSTPEKTCDAAESAGIAMRPHGCATSEANGKVYCNMAGPGVVAVIDIDADPPSAKALTTTGKGGGYAKAGSGGAYVYTVQNEPREGNGGASCQVGQMLTISTATDTIVHEMPLFYKGPGCTDVLTGTDEEGTGQNHMRITADGKLLFIAESGGFGDAEARIRQHLVVDLSDPSKPAQLPSIQVGASTGQRGSAISGDGKWLFVADSVDGTVTQIDIMTLAVSRTLTVEAQPLQVSTFDPEAGPSLQVGPVH
jgi:YVTN family beta-propeller protein